MKTFFSKSELLIDLNDARDHDKSIGLVPTMGALHAGHASLVQKCIEENDIIVVSIFVNPTQFNNPEDLQKYPRNLQRDLHFLTDLSDKPIIVFAPNVNDVYSNVVESEHFDFHGLEKEMEGAFRPGHFDGVATIVSKLFQIVKPQNAYFGEKDFQQLLIIKKMVESLKLPVNIVPCEIFREEDGLAMSSRNERLNQEQRAAAPLIYKVLETAKNRFGIDNARNIEDWVEDQFKSSQLLELEYFNIADIETLKPIRIKEKDKKYRAFIAVFAGDVRLIDNIALN